MILTSSAQAWQCFETEPKVTHPPLHPFSPSRPSLLTSHSRRQIDYEKFKNVAGLASAHSARELMRVTKNKLKSEYGALGADLKAANSGTNTPTKKTPSKAAGTPKTTTPGSRKRGPSGKKKSKAEMEEAVNGGGEEESGVSADAENESPSKKAKKTSGVKADPEPQEGGFFADDGLFQ